MANVLQAQSGSGRDSKGHVEIFAAERQGDALQVPVPSAPTLTQLPLMKLAAQQSELTRQRTAQQVEEHVCNQKPCRLRQLKYLRCTCCDAGGTPYHNARVLIMRAIRGI